MKKWDVKDSGYSLIDGFAWVIFTADNEEFTLQACLRERAECVDDEKRWERVNNGKNIYKKEINRADDGMLDGICWDINKPAFKKYGQDECYTQFDREARKMGIRFI